MRRKTIFLVEKDEKYVKQFRLYFEKEKYAVLHAFDGEEAMDIFADYNTDIDIVVISNNLQEIKGCEVLMDIRTYCDVPVIMLMEGKKTEPQMMMYRMGADDCVARETSFPLLKMKMEVFLRRVYGEDNSLQEGILELDLDKRTLKVEEEYIDITIKEFELLQYFMRNKHAIQTREQILTAVWGINYEGTDRVVDSLVKKLRIKLKTASEYIHTAYGMGYYFELPISKSA